MATEVKPPKTGIAQGRSHPRTRGRIRRYERLLKAGIDALAVLVAVSVGELAAGGLFDAPWTGTAYSAASEPALVAILLTLGTFLVTGAYPGDGVGRPGKLSVVIRLPVAAAIIAWLLLLIAAGTGVSFDLSQLLIASIVLPLVALAGRGLLEGAISRQPDRVLLIGTGQVSQRVLAVARRNSGLGIEVVGFVDDDPMDLPDGAPPLLGSISELEALLEYTSVDRVIVAFTNHRDHDMLELLRKCDRHGVPVDVVPRLFDLLGEEARAHSIGGLALVGIRGQQRGLRQRAVKRATDVLIASAGAVVLFPVLVAISAAIKLDDGGAIFFRQQRVGRDGRLFDVVKFRTMAAVAPKDADATAARADAGDDSVALQLDEVAKLVEDVKRQGEARTTRVGRFLRKTSLDELPQLWNVIVGEMSLVGPRPLRPFEVSSLSDWQLTRQQVRPGITGLWQVVGRSEIPWGERLQLDYTYVRHWSNASDIKIILRTIPAVLVRKGAR